MFQLLGESLLLVIFWLCCAIAGAMIGSGKGAAGMGFVLGLLLGPFGVLFAWLMQGERKPCPHCRALIHREATVCPSCQREPVAPSAEISPEARAAAADLDLAKASEAMREALRVSGGARD